MFASLWRSACRHSVTMVSTVIICAPLLGICHQQCTINLSVHLIHLSENIAQPAQICCPAIDEVDQPAAHACTLECHSTLHLAGWIAHVSCRASSALPRLFGFICSLTHSMRRNPCSTHSLSLLQSEHLDASWLTMEFWRDSSECTKGGQQTSLAAAASSANKSALSWLEKDLVCTRKSRRWSLKAA